MHNSFEIRSKSFGLVDFLCGSHIHPLENYTCALKLKDVLTSLVMQTCLGGFMVFTHTGSAV